MKFPPFTAQSSRPGWLVKLENRFPRTIEAAAALPTRIGLSTQSDEEQSTVSDNKEQAILKRAYIIWEKEGRETDKDLEHWLRAESEIVKAEDTANSLDSIRKAIEDGATISSGLWLSYIFVFFYIAIAASAITHVDLLLQNPVKLPFLNIDLPLVGFFLLIPFLFIILHAYTLVHFVMLAAKAGRYNEAMRDHLPDAEDIQETLRRQLPNNIFLQFLAGPNNVRQGGLGYILKIIAWTTLVIGPILLLLLLQIQFLPFHHKYITWMHRFALGLDIALIWALWPAVLAGRDKIEWPRIRLAKMAAIASIFIVGFSCLVATFPGERQDNVPAFLRIIPVLGNKNESGETVIWTSVHDFLFNGVVDPTSRRRTSISSSTLVLPGFNVYEALKVDDPKKVDWHEHLIDLRGRDLIGAVFTKATLTKADLNDARLQRAALDGATLSGASLYRAQLQGAVLDNAQLQGAALDDANLEGASSISGQFQAATLVSADLNNASLTSAQLQGASLVGAQFQGAVLDSAQLQGAAFDAANLENARFVRANLEGASFGCATIHGKSPVCANIQGASFIAALVWMADVREAIGNNVKIDGFSIWPCTQDEPGNTCTIESIKNLIRETVPQGGFKNEALAKIDKHLGLERTDKEKDDIAKAWNKHAATH